MPRIKIEDLEPLEELTDDQLGGIMGGFSLDGGGTMYDAWNPTNSYSTTTTLYDPTMTMYDAWMPGG